MYCQNVVVINSIGSGRIRLVSYIIAKLHVIGNNITFTPYHFRSVFIAALHHIKTFARNKNVSFKKINFKTLLKNSFMLCLLPLFTIKNHFSKKICCLHYCCLIVS